MTAADQQTTAVELRMLERTPTNDWQAAGTAIPARIGRNGMAWGRRVCTLRHPLAGASRRKGTAALLQAFFASLRRLVPNSNRPGLSCHLQCRASLGHRYDVRSSTTTRSWMIAQSPVTGPCRTMVPAIGCTYKLGASSLTIHTTHPVWGPASSCTSGRVRMCPRRVARQCPRRICAKSLRGWIPTQTSPTRSAALKCDRYFHAVDQRFRKLLRLRIDEMRSPISDARSHRCS